MSALTVSLIQTATHWHDPSANRNLFDKLFDDVGRDTQIVVLPEMCTTGFTMHSAEVAEAMDGPTVRWFLERAQSLDAVLCGSVVIRSGAQFFNRFLWATPDGQLQTYDKRHLFRMAGEHEHYAAGSERLQVTLGQWRICPMICYDLRFPVWLRNAQDYDLLLCVANWPAARAQAWRTLLSARAIENQSYVAAVNILGTDGAGVRYCGDSLVCDPQGSLLVDAADGSGVHTATLDLDDLRAYRAAFPAWQDADSFSVLP